MVRSINHFSSPSLSTPLPLCSLRCQVGSYGTVRFIHQSVQSLSYVWFFASPWTQSTPGLPVHHQLLEFTQTHVHWVSELFLHWSLVAYWAPTNLGFHLSVSYLFAFSYSSWVLKARILKWFAIPFSSGPHFVRTLRHHPSILGGPTWHGSEFPELDKAVVHVVRFMTTL